MNESKFTNHLISETSPYLLQHAHNPVDWYPWSEEAWQKARNENKLVIVSIGYSSCHWCHVMERESFEDTSVAEVMNKNFVCIKVDREERPDVDQVYMTAAQLMTGTGGWPLNCITLPDGRPIFGGTYFPKNRWVNVLGQLAEYYRNNQEDAEEYATKLVEGIQQSELVKPNAEEAVFSLDELKLSVNSWKDNFDPVEGGSNRAPKFPMPNNYEFLLHYATLTGELTISDHVFLTLNKMAFGGIYDHLGGGFARYSTDATWKVPHFEKMLYDNAQLVSLYSVAYKATGNELYRQVVYETCDFIQREMTSPDGGFYSALDADSEGEEGKFYVWSEEELKKLLGNRFSLFAEYFNVNLHGHWEEGHYILLRRIRNEEIAKNFSLSVQELKKEIAESKKFLLEERNKRIRPGLDDKKLTSWNALMIKGYCDAYNAFGDRKFLDAAIKNATYLLEKAYLKDGSLRHSTSARATLPRLGGDGGGRGFLEDYSFSAEAFIALYQCTLDEQWLHRAKEITDYALKHFQDPASGMFYFTSDEDPALIARKTEIHDNVIPSSNSSMAKVLYTLDLYFDDENYSQRGMQMLNNVKNDIRKYPSAYSNWSILMLHHTTPFYEIVITGKDALKLRNDLAAHFLPHTILAGAMNEKSELSLLENRFVEGKNLIYVCENKACKLPVESVKEAVNLIELK